MGTLLNGHGMSDRILGRIADRRRRDILVATALDETSVPALKRGHALAEVFGARLHVMHVLSRVAPALEGRADIARAAVREWAEREAKVVLSDDAIFVATGDPAMLLAIAAEDTSADLLVIGRAVRDGSTMHRLTRTITRPLLVADRPRTRTELVAATDMVDPRFPIIHSAARLARALAAHVTVVHNVEGSGPTIGVRLDTVLERVDALERLSRELAAVRAANVGSSKPTPEAIAEIASSRDADMIVVGVREGHGSTLSALLDRTRGHSVLAVPLRPVEVAA